MKLSRLSASMNTRELKALHLAAFAKISYESGVWKVPSQSGNGWYEIRFPEAGASCTCEDWATRQEDCKHILATRIIIQREGGPPAPAVIDPDKPPPTRKRRERDMAKYHEARITEKRRFQVLLADLCRGIPEEAYKGGRRPTPISDVVFACVFKVYTTLSSDRFGTDLEDAHLRGYLSKPMHPNKVNTHLENSRLTAILKRLIGVSARPLRPVETAFGPDSTGFSTSKFDRWYDEKYGAYRSKHHWVKAHGFAGFKSHIVTAVEIGNEGDSTMFDKLVELTAENFDLKDKQICADKAYLSHEHYETVERLGGQLFVPFKVNSVPGEAGTVWEKSFLHFQLRRDDFLNIYHQRSNIESVFSQVKEKFEGHVRSRTEPATTNEVLCKFLAHNICVVHQWQIDLGIETTFWPQDPKPTILPLVRSA